MEEIKWYENIPLDQLKNIIRSNIHQSTMSFNAIGYYLKNIRDRELYLNDGYESIWEFAQQEFGLGKSSASRFMSINDKFSVDGNSPILLEQYRGFSSSKLSEMLTLTDEQMSQVKEGMTREEIRSVKKPKELVNKVVAPAQQKEERNHLKPNTIDDLDLTVLTYNCLKRAGIDTINQLSKMTEIEVIKIRNISRKCLDEIKDKLSEIGKALKASNPIEEKECTGECFWCADDKCNSYQEHRVNCLFDSTIKCSIYRAHQVATTTLDIDCKSSCCMSCQEDCGARCNHSAHGTMDKESDVIEECLECKLNGNTEAGIMECHPEKGEHKCWSGDEHEQAETVEVDIIQMVPEPEFTDQCTENGLKFNNWLKANNSSIAQIVNDVVYKIPLAIDKDPSLGSKVANGLISALILKTEVYYDYLTKELNIEKELHKPVQPDLPILKNNEQRKEFIDNYTSWPVWIEVKETGEIFYRYDFVTGESFVVKVSLYHKYIGPTGYEKVPVYGREEYYLLGAKSDNKWQPKTPTFSESKTNRSAMVDFLKDYQKREGRTNDGL